MDRKDNGGQAFPASCPIGNSGMTLRDWFAGQALGVLADETVTPPNHKAVAVFCYGIADAMLEERGR